MSIPLTPNHLAYAVAHPLRVAVIALLSDPAGPLGDCAARPEDALRASPVPAQRAPTEAAP